MGDRDGIAVLIAGGGVAALEAALALRALDEEGALAVEVLAPEPHFWYRPLSVAEPFGLGEAHRFALSGLVAEAGGTFVPGRLEAVDVARRIAYTSPGGPREYSALLVAVGTRPRAAVAGALTFRGPADTAAMNELLAEVDAGGVRRIAFAVPAGAVWSLPAYELALMTSSWLAARDLRDVDLSLVTPEDEPLGLFGHEASGEVRDLLDARGIALHTGAYPVAAREGELLLVGGGLVSADRVVSLPRLEGPRIGGLPQTIEGFVPVDEHGRVEGLEHVYAAGDITTFPLKQGGLAAQQADAAAEAIAAAAWLGVEPAPFRPVLRGLLLTGDEPRYLRAELAEGRAAFADASPEPLWWPPAKLVGRYLAPFLAERAGGTAPPAAPPEGAVSIEVELDEERIRARRRTERLDRAVEEWLGDSAGPTVADVMSTDVLVVAPEDTLGEVAEQMQARGVGSALVSEYGRLVGILTSRDLLRALAARLHSSEARARAWMTVEPVVVSPATSAAAAALLMAEHGIHHLPVVDGDRPVGMIGLRDVVRSGPPSEIPLKVGLGL